MDRMTATPTPTPTPTTTPPGLRAHDKANLVEVDALKVYFPIRGGMFRKPVGAVKAIDGVTLDVRRGETLGLVGESGCGKSTIGRAMIRLRLPTDGSVRFDGADLASLSKNDLRRMRRRMQIIFQDPYGSLDPRMTVGATIAEPIVRGLAKGWTTKVRPKLDAELDQNLVKLAARLSTTERLSIVKLAGAWGSKQFESDLAQITAALMAKVKNENTAATERLNVIAALLPGPWNPTLAAKLVSACRKHTTKASIHTRAPSCSDPYRSIRRGSSAGRDWRSYCCPAEGVQPSAHR
jgi:ABC-type dipeptide/oligopeptide/nickel transport system ATPase subunit